MPSSRELEQAASELQEFRLQSEQHNRTHAEILEKYAVLMDDYKRLLSDFEEAREAREKYKQLARGSEANPFALVLVDGDGYLFEDDLVRDGREDGGSRAASLLNDFVKASLRSLGLENCRVMVRVYMNLAGLSKAMSQAKIPNVGAEKRSLAPFVANFNRSSDLFDIVDAGELKENADFKIRAMFRQFVENSQCKHIYFAACHDVGYISELVPYRANRDRITLVRSNGFHPEFHKLGFRTEDFPRVFRTTGLFSGGAPSVDRAIAQPVQPTNTPSIESGICTFYPHGLCKYGKGCKFLHIDQNEDGFGPGASSWRKSTASLNKSSNPFNTSSPTKSNNDFMNGHKSNLSLDGYDLSILLPKEKGVPPTKIPVNKDQERIDYYIPLPSPESRALFKARIAKAKLCNSLHILGSCINVDCQYDHNTITEGIRSCLRQVSQSQPCPRRGACRSTKCASGHICQKDDCKYRGGKAFCKFPVTMHMMDLNVADYIAIDEASIGENESGQMSPALSMSEADENRPGVPLSGSDESLD